VTSQFTRAICHGFHLDEDPWKFEKLHSCFLSLHKIHLYVFSITLNAYNICSTTKKNQPDKLTAISSLSVLHLMSVLHNDAGKHQKQASLVERN
jgi:hypothetical protein